MYEILTSYFSSRGLSRYKEAQLIPICNTLYNPSKNYSTWLNELAPDLDIMLQYQKVKHKTRAIKDWFKGKYLEKLDRLYSSSELDKIVSDLVQRSQYTDVILLCYEKTSEFCHRHVLREFLNKHYDLHIYEV